MTGNPGIPTPGSGGSFLTNKRSGRHLPACHSINSVIDKNDRQVFSTVCGVDRLAGSDCRQISVSLIGKNNILRTDSLYSRSHSQRPSVGSLTAVKIPIIISKHSATYRRNCNNLISNIQFIHNLGNQPMDNSVAAARAIMS